MALFVQTGGGDCEGDNIDGQDKPGRPSDRFLITTLSEQRCYTTRD